MANDLTGRPVVVMDYCAVAFRQGNGYELRLGKVIELFPGEEYDRQLQKHVRVVDYQARFAWYNPKDKSWFRSVGKVRLYSDRYMIVPLPDHVPPYEG